MLRLLITSLLLTLLTSCGFQLRGSVELPAGVEPIFIGGNAANTTLGNSLKNQLRISGVELSEQVSQANYQLVLLEQKTDRRTTALGENATALEYQLIESLRFQLENKAGEIVLGPNRIVERRTMPNDANRVVSSTEEEKILRREMRNNLAAKVVRQLTAFDYTAKP